MVALNFFHHRSSVSEEIKSILDQRSLSLQFDVDETKDVLEFLNDLLIVARILKLNEDEIYFLEPWSLGPLNPRNEFQALLCIRKVISSCDDGCVSLYLSSLLNAIDSRIDLLDSFSSPQKSQGMVVASSMPTLKKNHALIDWAVEQGIQSNVIPEDFPATGRGAAAKCDIHPSSLLLDIPRHLILSVETAMKSDMGPVLRQIEGLDDDTSVLLWSIRESQLPDSPFAPYFDSLPDTFHTGLSMSAFALQRLEGTVLFEQIVAAKEHVRIQYDVYFPALSVRFPQFFCPQVYCWENYLRAIQLWYSNGLKITMEEDLESGVNKKTYTCLVPVLGLFNHSIIPHVSSFSQFDSEKNSLRIVSERYCKQFQQCFLTYGPFSSSHFLLWYGFVSEEENPLDIIPIDLEISDEDSLILEKYKILKKYNIGLQHMVRKCEFEFNNENNNQKDIEKEIEKEIENGKSKRRKFVNDNFSMYYEKRDLPTKLLACLRVLAMDEEEIENYNGNIFIQTVSEKNELIALEMLRDTIDSLLSACDFDEDDDEEDDDQDIYYANLFKSHYISLLQSIKYRCESRINSFF